ncbi:thiol reductant ABC exporter subunit CydC [Sporomusa termitida]|uniref:Multidrug export ATP-binding/permease protein n=1 Tax=Sporomusa termitida TaxID=2377 RepID=A0A517E0V2_9FIRM|nr:thiol reductant ABC exporter subunit CydC [Sporomusa termitida]QDR83232.1 Putative multidrug export ATP-binding/permease protein [Sporomusa termitida]
MFKLLLGSRRTLGLAAVACILGSLTVYAGIGLMAASAWLISAAALQPPLATLSVAIVGVRFFGLARAGCRYLERYMSHSVTFRLLADIRVWLYTRLEPLAPAGLQTFTKGDVFSRLVADVETLQYFYLRAALPALIAVLTATATLLLLGAMAPALVWPVAGAFLAAGGLLPALIARLAQRTGRQAIRARAALNGALTDSIEGLTELAALGRAELQTAKVTALNREYMASQKQGGQIIALADALGTMAMQLAIIAVVALAVPLVSSGSLGGIYLAVVALTVQASFEAVLPLPAVIYYWRECQAALRRLQAISGLTPAAGHAGTKEVEPGSAALVARSLTFTYHAAAAPVLADITFSLPAAKRLAIVGASGAGKSTLAGIILRFWDHNSGQLLLNGVDIRDYDPASVRQALSVVSQDTYLFNATIRDNILLAKPAATETELKNALIGAQLEEFLARLPQGLETRTGQNGLALSGGERQRIALARALLKAAPIWLLDEPTAGLDACAEAAVMENILQVSSNRSVILITHRLTGLAAMDEILVLENGRIAEQGTWAELLANRGVFLQMWTIQQDLLNIS